MTLNPQKKTEPVTPTQYLYCVIVGSFVWGTSKAKENVIIDYGQETAVIPSHWLNETKNDLGIDKRFKHMVDALNFMTSLGWEFVQAYVVINNVDYNCYHYLMKRAKE